MTKQDYIQKLLDEQSELMVDQLRATGVSPRLFPEFFKGISDILEDMFTQEELALMVEFTCSPIGKQLNQKMPEYMQACFQMGERISRQATGSELDDMCDGFANYVTTAH